MNSSSSDTPEPETVTPEIPSPRKSRTRRADPHYEEWVSQQLQSASRFRIAGAIGCLLAALLVLYITWWVLYGMLWMTGFTGANREVRLSSATWLAWLGVFPTFLLIKWRQIDSLDFNGQEPLWFRKVKTQVSGWPIRKMAESLGESPFGEKLSVSLLSGPQLLLMAGQYYLEYEQIQRGDITALARILMTLHANGIRLDFEELEKAAQSTSKSLWLPQLAMLDGVVIRESPPAGATLTDGAMQTFSQFDNREN